MGNGHGQNRSIEVGVFFMDCMGLMWLWLWMWMWMWMWLWMSKRWDRL